MPEFVVQCSCKSIELCLNLGNGGRSLFKITRFRVLILLALLLCRNLRGFVKRSLASITSLDDWIFIELVEVGVGGADGLKILELLLDASVAGVGSLGTPIGLSPDFDR